MELGQWRRLVIQRSSSSLKGRVDGRAVLSGGAADARERAHTFRPQLSPPSPGNLFPPTTATVPPAQVVPLYRRPPLEECYLFTLFTCQRTHCSRALLFKEGLRYVGGDACAAPHCTTPVLQYWKMLFVQKILQQCRSRPKTLQYFLQRLCHRVGLLACALCMKTLWDPCRTLAQTLLGWRDWWCICGAVVEPMGNFPKRNNKVNHIAGMERRKCTRRRNLSQITS